MKTRFDHLSLSAKDPEGMKDFLCQLLNLQAGTRPGFSFQGYFLYAGGDDVIHIFGRSSDSVRRDTVNSLGVQDEHIVHHISFYSDDYDETIRRIDQLNVNYTTYNVPDSDVKQLFVRAPENLIIEIQATPKYS